MIIALRILSAVGAEQRRDERADVSKRGRIHGVILPAAGCSTNLVRPALFTCMPVAGDTQIDDSWVCEPLIINQENQVVEVPFWRKAWNGTRNWYASCTNADVTA